MPHKSTERINFGKLREVIQPPNLIELQISSYLEYLQKDTPEKQRKPFGLEAVFREKEVVGMDFVELSPNGQFHAEMTAAQLVYHAIGLKGLQAGWLSREVDHI